MRLVRRTGVAGLLVLTVMTTLACGAVPSRESAGSGPWTVLPPAPIDLTGVQTGVWTGREALFTFPSRNTRTAAAYNPATNTWRRLPGAPAPSMIVEGGDRSVWTGKDWLVLGQGPFLAYRPATNRWRTLRRPSTMPANTAVAWAGSQMIGWGGGCCGDFMGDGAAYTPATNTWRRLPPSPLAPRQSVAGVWTGREFILVGGFAERLRTVTFADAAAYDPATRTWRRLPPMPAGRRDTVVVWTGRDLLVVGGTGPKGAVAGVFAYRPATNRWRVLSPLPRPRRGHVAVWTGTRLLVWGGDILRDGEPTATATGLSYNPTTHRWSAIPAAPIVGRAGATAVWTGRSMIVVGGGLPGADVAASFSPGR